MVAKKAMRRQWNLTAQYWSLRSCTKLLFSFGDRQQTVVANWSLRSSLERHGDRQTENFSNVSVLQLKGLSECWVIWSSSFALNTFSSPAFWVIVDNWVFLWCYCFGRCWSTMNDFTARTEGFLRWDFSLRWVLRFGWGLGLVFLVLVVLVKWAYLAAPEVTDSAAVDGQWLSPGV